MVLKVWSSERRRRRWRQKQHITSKLVRNAKSQAHPGPNETETLGAEPSSVCLNKCSNNSDAYPCLRSTARWELYIWGLIHFLWEMNYLVNTGKERELLVVKSGTRLCDRSPGSPEPQVINSELAHNSSYASCRFLWSGREEVVLQKNLGFRWEKVYFIDSIGLWIQYPSF